MKDAAVHIEELQFRWRKDARLTLDIPHLHVGVNESLFLYGPSGCGKSTLLSLMAGVLSTSHGKVSVCGKDWSTLGESARDRHRANNIGYIFQQFNLLPYLNVLDNVLLPCRLSDSRNTRALEKSVSIQEAACHWLQGMGIPKDSWLKPARELSVGQQQRVAAARALIGSPSLIIADEPTSALDEGRQSSFLDLLQSACKSTGSALVLVSHDKRIAARFDRTVLLPEINLVTDSLNVQ